jgi:hypothetical protein
MKNYLKLFLFQRFFEILLSKNSCNKMMKYLKRIFMRSYLNLFLIQSFFFKQLTKNHTLKKNYKVNSQESAI